LKSEVERIWAAGHTVLFDVDVLGGLNLKKQLGDEAMAIFIQPPSVNALRERLIGRATDSMEKIEERVAKAEYELSFAAQFDRVVVNDRLEEAFQEAEQIVRDFLAK
jgi:guanylate kinase